MFESAKEGFLGLFLVLGQWLSPGGDDATLRAAAQFSGDTLCVVQCALQTSWSQELSDLVDAGIPLRFRLSAMTDAGDTMVFIRTLRCDIADYTYSFCDSMVTALPREPSTLKNIPRSCWPCASMPDGALPSGPRRQRAGWKPSYCPAARNAWAGPLTCRKSGDRRKSEPQSP